MQDTFSWKAILFEVSFSVSPAIGRHVFRMKNMELVSPFHRPNHTHMDSMRLVDGVERFGNDSR